MKHNKLKPYLLILPEDKEVRDLVQGALEFPGFGLAANVGIESLLKGWRKLERRLPEICEDLRRKPHGHLLICIDFDGHPEKRREEVGRWIPEDLKHRIFVMACRNEPKNLKRELGASLTAIGERLVAGCPDHPDEEAWGCDQLSHNHPERERFLDACSRILF